MTALKDDFLEHKHQKQLAAVAAEVQTFEGPAWVNGGPDTAPSKRLIKALPCYRKTTHSFQGASRLGLSRLRQGCPHFNAWLNVLEERLGQLKQFA
jgi:hypothetical protein